MSTLDEVLLEWIGEAVDHPAEDVARLDAFDDVGLLGGPHVLPAAVMRIDAFRDEQVESCQELWVYAVGVEDAVMNVLPAPPGYAEQAAVDRDLEWLALFEELPSTT